MNRACRAQRGFAIAIVLWAVAMAAMALAAVQMAAARQASGGREALARVRAHWAARAGIEQVIARVQAESKQSSPMGASSLLADLATISEGSFGSSEGQRDGVEFSIVHQNRQGEAPGPVDPHAKININRMTQADLLLLPDMTEELAAAILDWIDADEDVRDGGAELETYGALASSYKPRNGPVRDLRELELVRGVLPEYVRGEDWNLNGVLDPNEDDGDESWPPDDADGVLTAGWSEFVTAASIEGGTLAPDGSEKVDLTTADATAIATAVGCDDTQATVIATWAQQNTEGRLSTFITTPLSTLQQQQQQQSGGRQRQAQALNDQQLTALLDRCTVGDPSTLTPGKININTVDVETLEYLAIVTPEVRDALVAARDGASGDLLSLVELRQSGFDNATLAAVYEVFTTRSSSLLVTCKGRDQLTGVEVELSAIVDRTADPVVIRRIVVR